MTTQQQNSQEREQTMHVATATAPGSAHINPGRPGKTNNQDAFATRKTAKGFVTVICDGCGSQPYSGTGSDIGANIIANILKKHLNKGVMPGNFDCDKITQEVAAAIRIEAAKFADDSSTESFEATVVDRFLFTALALIVSGEEAEVIRFGDGIVLIDEELMDFLPPIENAPPYLGYLLINNSSYHAEELRPHLKFSSVRHVSLPELDSGLVIGTDGLRKLIGEDLHHPALVQGNNLQKWLNAQTMETVKNDRLVPSRCDDDITLCIIRTEKAQERLLECRTQIVDLKQLIAVLEQEIDDFASELNRSYLTMPQATKAIGKLDKGLEELEAKSSEIKACERKIAALKSRINRLREEIPDKVKVIFVPVFTRTDISYFHPTTREMANGSENGSDPYHFPTLWQAEEYRNRLIRSARANQPKTPAVGRPPIASPNHQGIGEKVISWINRGKKGR